MEYWIFYTATKVMPADLIAWHGTLGNAFQDRPAWHNHDLETGRSILRYPQVQYKILKHALAIISLGGESKTLFTLGQSLPQTFWVENRPRTLIFRALERHPHDFTLLSKKQKYRCNNWIPMNSKQYHAYRAICYELGIDPGTRTIDHPKLLAFFEGLLTEQLQWHLRGFGYEALANSATCILNSPVLKHYQTSYYHDTQVSMIKDMVFSTNINWPVALGFGIGAAVGYGMFVKTS